MKVLVACEFSGIVREAFCKRGHDAWSCDLLPTEIPGNHIQGDVLRILHKRDCAKTITKATLYSPSGVKFYAENWCENPQLECPRKDMKTGEGYELCKSICRQSGHAEVNVCKLAGEQARGGHLFLEGHTYICESCLSTMRDYGIKEWTIGTPPDNRATDNKYSDIGQWDLMIAHPPCTHLAVAGAVWFKKKREDGRQQQAIDFFMKLINANINRIAVENPPGIMSTVFRKPSQYIQPFWFGENAQKKEGLWLKNLPLLKPTKIVDRGEIYIEKDGTKRGGKWTMCLPPSSDRWKIRSRTFQGIADVMAEQWG